MKTVTKFFGLAIAIGMLVFSCQPENVGPKSDNNSSYASPGAADEEHPRPDPQCSESHWFDLVATKAPVYPVGTPVTQNPPQNYQTGPFTAAPQNGAWDYGILEIANDNTDWWVILALGAGWMTSNEAVYAGTLANAPVSGGQFNTEAFTFNYPISPSRAFFQFHFDATGFECADFVVFAKIHRTSVFPTAGLPTYITEVWAAGMPYLNGYAIPTICFTECPTVTLSDTCVFAGGNNVTIGVTGVDGGVAPYTYSWRDASGAASTEFATTAEISVNPSVNTEYVLVVRDVMGNGDSVSYSVCATSAGCECGGIPPIEPVEISANCTNIMTGLPANVNGGSTCATLIANPSSGTGTYSFSWTGPAGFTASGSTIFACQGGTYTVTMTDAYGQTATASVTVTTTSIRCGNLSNNNFHKVEVCHLPPGNVANVQNICIDWDGVPAHVARFRDPSYNPLMGHDSGCEIGPCGYVGCR